MLSTPYDILVALMAAPGAVGAVDAAPGAVGAVDAMAALGPRPAWMNEAACADPAPGDPGPAAYFPGRPDPATEAKAVCARCPVRADCLAFALAGDERGVWGGLTESERRLLRRR